MNEALLRGYKVSVIFLHEPKQASVKRRQTTN